MRLRDRSRRRLLFGLSLLLGPVTFGACGFADPITWNPNTVAQPELDHILAAATRVSWTRASDGRWGAYWIQQLDGTPGLRDASGTRSTGARSAGPEQERHPSIGHCSASPVAFGATRTGPAADVGRGGQPWPAMLVCCFCA